MRFLPKIWRKNENFLSCGRLWSSCEGNFSCRSRSPQGHYKGCEDFEGYRTAEQPTVGTMSYKIAIALKKIAKTWSNFLAISFSLPTGPPIKKSKFKRISLYYYSPNELKWFLYDKKRGSNDLLCKYFCPSWWGRLKG